LLRSLSEGFEDLEIVTKLQQAEGIFGATGYRSNGVLA
jgi:hypothetical protein